MDHRVDFDDCGMDAMGDEGGGSCANAETTIHLCFSMHLIGNGMRKVYMTRALSRPSPVS